MIIKPLVTVEKDSHVVVVEDDKYRRSWFHEKLASHVGLFLITDSVDKAMDWIRTSKREGNDIDAFFLDHDLGEEHYKHIYDGETDTDLLKDSGTDLAERMKREGFTGENTVIHSYNKPGAERMKEILPNAVWIPFGGFDIKIQE